MAWNATGLAALLLAIAITAIWLKIWPRMVPWLMLLAGAALAGTLGSVLGWFGDAAASVGGQVTGWLFGVAAPAVVTVVLGIVLFHQMRKRGSGPRKATPWLALAFVPIAAATFGLGTQLSQWIDEGLAAGADQIAATIDEVSR